MKPLPIQVQNLYDLILLTRGALQLYPTAKNLLAAWGLLKQSSLQLMLDIFTNRLAGWQSDPSALASEFQIPNDARLLADKMTWCSMRGCTGAIFGMLNAMGHPNVSIYNYGGRIDSPFATNIQSSALDSAHAQQFMLNRYAAILAAASGTALRDLQYHMFTVAIWDVQTNSTIDPPVIGTSQVGSYLGHAGPNEGSDEVFYTGETSQQTIVEVVRFGCGAQSIPMEVFLCYPNQDTDHGSAFDEFGDPVEPGFDIIETLYMDVLNF